MPDNALSTVQVVLRVRPSANESEAVTGTSRDAIAMAIHGGPWDMVFDPAVTQRQVFERSVAGLVSRFVEGVNVSILAYGRPFSGKSYTLGTSKAQEQDQQGIILRAAAAVFQGIAKKQGAQSQQTALTVDDTMRPPPRRVQSNARIRPTSMIVLPRRESSPNLRTDRATRYSVQISMACVTNDTIVNALDDDCQEDRVESYTVASVEDVKRYLKRGIERSSSAGDSHSVFSISVQQECWVSKPKATATASRKATTLPTSRRVFPALNVKEIVGQMEKLSLGDEEGEWVRRITKLHIVDLSGSSCGSPDILDLLSGKNTVHTSITPCNQPALMRTLQHSQGRTMTLVLGCVSTSTDDVNHTQKTITELGHIKLNNATPDDPMHHVNLRELVSQVRTKVSSLKQDHPDSGDLSPSISSTDPSEPHRMSTETSSSSLATTVSLDMFGPDTQQQLLLSDLKRQVEELHNQVTVTHERNGHVEKELERLRTVSTKEKHDNAHTVARLESELSKAQAALTKSNKVLAGQASILPASVCQAECLDKDTQALMERDELVKVNQDLQQRLNASEKARQLLEQQHKALQQEKQQADDQLKNMPLLETYKSRLEERVKSLTQSEKSIQGELKLSRSKSESLQKHIWDHEQGTQIALRSRLEELEKLKRGIDTLRSVEEKQDAVICGLEKQNKDLESLSQSMQQQLRDRDTAIAALEEANQESKSRAQLMQKEVESVLRDVCGMGAERKQLEKVIDYFESTLRQQEAKTEKTFQTLQDLRHQYTGREKELEEKRRTVELLEAQKEELSQSLEMVRGHSTKHDQRMQDMEKKLKEAEKAITAQIALNKDLEMSRQLTDIDIQRGRALESRVEELDQLVTNLEKKRNEAFQQLDERKKEMDRLQHKLTRQAGKSTTLEKKVAELEETIQTERALVRGNDTSGMISKLEKKIDMLEQAKKASEEDFEMSYEKALNELEEARQEVHKQQQFIQSLQAKYHRHSSGDPLDLLAPLSQPGNRESILSLISSPPQTPRVSTSSPHLIKHRLSLGETDTSKRASNSSIMSDMSGLRSLLGLRSRSSTPNLPPPLAPPSSPLPPIPSPSSPTLSTRSFSSNESLANLGSPMTADQFQTMIMAYQTKLRQSENDARARQEAVTDLEDRIAQHETSTSEIKTQLQKSRKEASDWQAQLQRERDLKLKAEKARSILEKRLDDLMSKRNRFICF